MENTKKVYGYIRVSTNDQANSLEAQRDRIEAYARYNNLEVVSFLTDEDVSGGKPIFKRPAGVVLHHMPIDISGVVSTRLDRMFRSTIDALTTAEFFNKRNISIYLCDNGGVSLDTSTAMGKLVFTMMASVATCEREKTSERMKDIIQHKKSKGRVYGALPLGYDDVDGQLTPNEEEMSVVKQIFYLRSTNKSMGSIAGTLNEEGAKSKNGGKFFASTIRNILNNSIYSTILETVAHA